MTAQTAVIGSGAWGTAIAKVIADKGKDVVMWCLEEKTRDDINLRHQNTGYLRGIKLPKNIKATTDILEAVNEREYIILAVPSLYLLDTVKQILPSPTIREGKAAIAVLTKGFLSTGKGPRLILETMEDYLPGSYRQSLVYISGPSHAEEVSRGSITGLIAASENARNSIGFRNLLRTKNLLVFSSFDVCGVQVAAAAKNVIAIGFGMLDALKNLEKINILRRKNNFGSGTESLLLAAGLNEIQTLGKAMGATHPETFTSISGIGDLDVSCRSVFGRNRRFGKDIIEKNILKKFKNIDDLIARIDEVGYMPEGVVAAKYVKELTKKHMLKAPVSSGIFQILNRKIEPSDCLKKLLNEPNMRKNNV